MEHQEKLKLLNETGDSKFMTKFFFSDPSNANYDAENKIINIADELKSNLCDCNNSYILVWGNIMIAGNIAGLLAFKNCLLLLRAVQNSTEQQ